MRLRIASIAISLLVIAATLVFLVDRRPSHREPPGYVGSATCSPCHASEDAAWRTSDHYLAMQPADSQYVLGDFNRTDFRHDGVTSTFFQRDGKFFVNTAGADGANRDFAIRYTFGVRPLQQYLVELPGGRFQALGIAWDSREKAQGGQRWFALYPDQHLKPGDALFWTGIDQTWNYQCAECHSTNLRRGYDAATRTYHTTFSEINVSCESCHGPGSAHVAWAKGGKKSGEYLESLGLTVRYRDRRDNAWVMDPVTGIAHRTRLAVGHDEVEACAFCHARRGVLREGHVPGRPITSTHRVSLLTEGLYHADGEIEGEVYEYGSFLQSRMYRAGVTCSDCHEPHTGRRYAQGNELCARCHLASKFDTPEHHHHRTGSAGAQCVSCHMLQRTYMGVDARRDHGFRVPRPDLAVELGTPSTCTDCHADHDLRWSRDAFLRWYGEKKRADYARALTAARAGAAEAPGALSALFRDPSVSPIVRATALAEMSNYPGDYLGGVVREAASDPEPLVREAAAGAAQSLPVGERISAIATLLGDSTLSVRTEAGRALGGVPAGALADAARAARDSALAEFVRTQRVNADRPEAWLNLGALEAQQGRVDAAERDYRTAISLDPTWEPAYVNLVDVLRAAGRDDEGERAARAGLEKIPNAAGLYHSLGLLQVRRREMDAAIASLGRASRLDPANARFAYVYVVALMETGHLGEARAALLTALDHSPRDGALGALRSQLEQKTP